MSEAAVSERFCDGNQDPAEFARFLDLVRSTDVRRYLEIGCRNGHTFEAVMRAIGPGRGGYGLAVDLPENESSREALRGAVASLMASGIPAEVLFGDSQNPAITYQVRNRGPFDLILIDGDHRYEGVKRDFEVYRRFARVVALHDVAAPRGHQSDGYENGVGVFWSEIKNRFRCGEFVTPGSQMGFGIVTQDGL